MKLFFLFLFIITSSIISVEATNVYYTDKNLFDEQLLSVAMKKATPLNKKELSIELYELYIALNPKNKWKPFIRELRLQIAPKESIIDGDTKLSRSLYIYPSFSSYSYHWTLELSWTLRSFPLTSQYDLGEGNNRWYYIDLGKNLPFYAQDMDYFFPYGKDLIDFRMSIPEHQIIPLWCLNREKYNTLLDTVFLDKKDDNEITVKITISFTDENQFGKWILHHSEYSFCDLFYKNKIEIKH